MTQRRSVLKGIAGLTTTSLFAPFVLAAPTKVRVTLVRWPYT